MSDDVDFDRESQRLRLVASARDESEYDVFVTSWTAWHGAEPSPGAVDRDFGAYLQERAIPPYVRHFVRQWIETHPGIRRHHAQECRAVQRARRLTLALIILAVIVALFIGR